MKPIKYVIRKKPVIYKTEQYGATQWQTASPPMLKEQAEELIELLKARNKTTHFKIEKFGL